MVRGHKQNPLAILWPIKLNENMNNILDAPLEGVFATVRKAGSSREQNWTRFFLFPSSIHAFEIKVKLSYS